MHGPEEVQFSDLAGGGIFRWGDFALAIAEQASWGGTNPRPERCGACGKHAPRLAGRAAADFPARTSRPFDAARHLKERERIHT